jgi:hypothetical protein
MTYAMSAMTSIISNLYPRTVIFYTPALGRPEKIDANVIDHVLASCSKIHVLNDIISVLLNHPTSLFLPLDD